MRRKFPPIQPGQVFGKLTVIREGRHGRINGDYFYNRRYLCRCECGKELFVSCSWLNGGDKRSCSGAVCRALIAGGKGLFAGCWSTNGPEARARTASSFRAMISRCTNPNHPAWMAYGGRGVTVCPEWLRPGGFEQFLHDMGARPKGKSLDRKNPFEGYSPENCRWASNKTQANNKRRDYPDGFKDTFGEPTRDPFANEMEQAVGF